MVNVILKSYLEISGVLKCVGSFVNQLPFRLEFEINSKTNVFNIYFCIGKLPLKAKVGFSKA